MTTTESASSASGYGHLGKIYVRNLSGPQNTRLEQVLYPTGESISFQDGTFPVYDTNLNGYALQILKKKEDSSNDSAYTIPNASSQKMVFPANAPKKKKK